MNYYLACPIGVIGGSRDLLTYHHDELIKPGAVVSIPFGRQTKLGIITAKVDEPSFKTKGIIAIHESTVPEHLISLATWISSYYASRLAVVMQAIVPRGLDKKRRPQQKIAQKILRSTNQMPLTAEQEDVINRFRTSSAITHLLRGVTGSGKTRVYQELAKDVLNATKSVLVLVPEISLTPQLASEFQQLHDNVLVLHSGLTESERHTYWNMLTNSLEPWVIVGPRSILFSPLTNVGLIIVDECHEPSYQQDSQPKYSALRVARKLAELSNAKLLLASATPTVADYYFAEQTQTPILQMDKPTKRRETSIEIVDMRDRAQFGAHSLFSKRLIDAMNNSLAQNEQILLFHNRRGTARMSLCSHCGWTAECTQCHIPLRLHHDQAILRCHTCGLTQKLPQVCPECKSLDIDFKGFGSKRVESEIKKLYPKVEIARFDGDTKEQDQLHHRYQELYDNKIQIIIGTQGIAKGLDLPHLNTVGVVHADSELFIPDFSSVERSFQLTTQVIGRAGRTGASSTVIIQTLNPEHPAITYAKEQNFLQFYKHELAERQAEHMPPHTFLLQLTVGYSSAAAAQEAAVSMKSRIKKEFSNVFVRGPSPAFHEHRGTQFYQQLVVSSSQRSQLTAIAQGLPQRWHFVLDPLNLL